jgi:hypothetical protein
MELIIDMNDGGIWWESLSENICILELLFGSIELSFKFNMSFGRELVVYLTKPSMFGKFVVHAWRFEDRTFYIGSWRAKLILAPLGMPK